MGTTRGAVKTRLHRARQALRTLLDPICRIKEPESPRHQITAKPASRLAGPGRGENPARGW
jgi:hypothetical protein